MTKIRLRRRIIRPGRDAPPQPPEPRRITSSEVIDIAIKLAAAEARIKQLEALSPSDDVRGARIRACLARLHALDELRELAAHHAA